MADVGPVVLCFSVVDEADIVREFLDYHLDLGVERFLATDLGSTDGTLDILAEYERAGCLELTRLSDPTVRGTVRDVDNPMANRAREHYRAAWCLFCDADEFWVFPGAMHDYLADPPAPIVNFPRCNMVPTRRPGSAEPDHFSAFDLVVQNPVRVYYAFPEEDPSVTLETLLHGSPPECLRAVPPKAMARADAFRWVRRGGHHVEPADPKMAHHLDKSGFIGHFPMRSAAQFAAKAKLVADFIAANPPQADQGSPRHWRRIELLYRNGRIDAEFARQILSEADVAAYLRRQVLRRDDRIAARLAALRDSRQGAAAA